MNKITLKIYVHVHYQLYLYLHIIIKLKTIKLDTQLTLAPVFPCINTNNFALYHSMRVLKILQMQCNSISQNLLLKTTRCILQAEDLQVHSS